MPVSRRTAEQLARQVADLFAETQSGVMGLPQQSAPAPVRAGGVTQGDESLSADDCTPSTTFIYALLDSRTGRVRYVGKSDDPDRRMREHCRGDRVNSHKDRWLAQLKREGLWPVLQVLEEVPYDEWQERECSWIAFYRDAGEPLTNMTLGGDGFDGLSADARARKHAAIKKAWADPEERAKQAERTTKYRAEHGFSPEERAKITEGLKKRWADPKARAAQSERMKAVAADPEWLARNRAAQVARYDDPDERAKQSAISRAFYSDQAKRDEQSARMKKVWAEQDPAVKERMKAKVRAAKATPEARARTSALAKAAWAKRKADAREAEDAS